VCFQSFQAKSKSNGHSYWGVSRSDSEAQKSVEIRWTTICRQMYIRCHLQNAKRMVKHLQIRRDVGSIGPLLY